jgi:flagellar hook-associated protein 1 FlgK
MAITPVFDVATRALQAQELVIRTTGHNLANVNRPGYSRQRVELTSERPTQFTPLVIGNGVRVQTVRQIVDPIVERQLLLARSDSAHSSTARDELARLEQLVAELDGTGLQNGLDAFFAAAADVALHPQGGAERTVFLARAETLAASARGRAGSLGELQRQVDDRVVAVLPRINGLLDNVARLNGEIFTSELNGHTANDLRDQRQEALGELSTLVGIAQFEAEDGVTVLGPDGILLVDGVRSTHLVGDTSTAPALLGLDGRALTRVGFAVGGGGFVEFTNPVSGGELGGLLGVRDGDIPATATSLDQLATALRTAVNAVHTSGEDLDGTAGTALFGGTGAGDLSVLITDPRQVAASAATGAAPNTPEDNSNALALAALASTALDGTDPAVGNADLGGQTFTGFIASIVADVGTITETAATRAEATEALTTQLEAQRAAVSGVNTDEELTGLLEAQRAYQAAAMLVTVATATLDALLEMAQ